MNRLGSRYRQLSALIALALLAAPAAAQDPVPATPQREHIVRRGDTLWDLAAHYLGNPFLWPMIYEANRSVVEDPHWIYPEERLIIPGLVTPSPQVLGQPVVETPAPLPPQPVAVDTTPAELSTVDLRRPLIPLAEYYSTPWIATAPQGELTGRIARIWDPSAGDDKLPAMLHPHYRVHIGELRGPLPVAGDTLLTVRIGREVSGWGQVVQPLALMRVDSIGTGILTATVLLQYAEARVGDRVMPLASMPEVPRGTTSPVADGPEGRLIEFLERQAIYGTGELGFVSLGEGQLRLGDQLAVYVPPRRIDRERAELLPAAEVARAVVLRVNGRTATVRLTRVVDTVVREGLPVRLVGRTP